MKLSVMENERQSQAVTTTPGLGELKLPRLILASSSQRRAEILRSVGWDFESLPVDIDETPGEREDAVEYVERLCREKAEAALRMSAKGFVLGADTTVVVDGDVLGKPVDGDDARGMLIRLSGRWHEVLTGVALIHAVEAPRERGHPARIGRDAEGFRCLVAHEATRVLFSALSDDEINWYISTGEPMGKAGAYAIQGRAALFIDKIEGDYWNVVGLPMRLVYKLTSELLRTLD